MVGIGRMSRKNRKSTSKKRTVSSKDDASSKGKGLADVAIRLIDALYDLAQTGNLIGLIIIAFVCWIFYVTYKLPPESLEGVLGGIGIFLVSEKFYFFPLGSALIVSVITNVVQARVYRSHVHDLTEHRKYLIHGIKSGELKPLETHRSAGFDVKSNAVKSKQGE